MKIFLNILVGITFLGIAIYLAMDVEGIGAKIMGVFIFGYGAFRSFRAIGKTPTQDGIN